MGCSNCGTGTPNGCKSNGGCSTGGCNRLNTHDWLRNMPVAFAADECKIVEVSFNKGSRKDYFRNTILQHLDKGDLVCVEGVSGFDLGEVSLTGEIVRLQLKKRGVKEDNAEMKKLLRRATDRDVDTWRHSKSREKEALIRSRAISKQLKLDMKVSEVEIQADSRKATFFYIADGRVDFRELIKIFAGEFKLKVEMRQIGARQESAKVGGIGSCGRELCCSTWLNEFKSVNTTAARYQNLSINQTKLSGQCGRLKCCLNYELDTYLDALQQFPENCDTLKVSKGNAFLIKKDIFKNLMWYTLPDSTKHYPVTIERVKKIKTLNAEGIIPEELEAVDLSTPKGKETEQKFVELVGQISLQSLEKADRKKKQQQQQKQQQKPQQNPNRQQGNQQRGPQQNLNPQQGQQKGQQQNPNRQQGNQQRGPQQNQGGQQRGRNQQRPNQQRPPQNPKSES